MDHGVIVCSYLSDNGIFLSMAFLWYIYQHVQQIHYCGINGHQNNGISERIFFTVSEYARSLLLHSSTRWNSGIDSTLWYLDVQYAAYIYSHMLSASNVAPDDVLHGTIFHLHKLRTFRVWGFPVYALYP